MRGYLFFAVAVFFASAILGFGQESGAPEAKRQTDHQDSPADPLQALLPPASLRSPWKIQAFNATDLKPLQGVTFRYTIGEWGFDNRYLFPGYFGADRAHFLKQHTATATSDTHGFVLLPGLADRAFASNDSMATDVRRFRHHSGGVEPEAALEPIIFQQVHVSNSNGGPAPYVSVGISEEFSRRGSRLLGFTNADGNATLALDSHSQYLLFESHEGFFAQTVGIPSTFIKATSLKELPDVISLQLPKAPSLELEFLFPDGSPFTETLLFTISDRNAQVSSRFEGGCTQGRSVVPAVGRGSKLFLRAYSWDGRYGGMVENFHVPETGGEVIKLSLTLEPASFTIRGRLFAADKKPVANAVVRCDWTSSDLVFADPIYLRTDEFGRFFGPYQGIWSFLDAWTLLTFHYQTPSGNAQSKSLPQREDLSMGVKDLGDIYLVEE